METSVDFNKKLFELAEAKKNWYDTEEMVKILEEYRNLLGVINNLINLLEKKGLIQPDPYKLDKKISDIAVPEEIPFLDSERSMVIGARLSDFESMLDFICNIFKFSVSTVSVERIKTLLALNNYFQWNALVPNSTKPNTKGLAEIVQAIKMGTDSLSVSVLNESINYITKTISRINALLKDLTDFQKELYKVEIRKSLFEHPNYSHEKSQKSTHDAMMQIKKMFPQVMGKKPFYSELVDELIREEYSPEKDKFRAIVLSKFEIASSKKEEKKIKIDTKEMLMDSVRALGSAAPLLEQISQKIEDNHKVLQSEHNGFMDKLLALIRQAFNRPEKPVVYTVTVTEPLTQSRKQEDVKYQDFLTDLNRRRRTYNSFAVKKAPGYIKIESQEEKSILEYLSKQISECNHLMQLLTALDEYFKSAPLVENRSKIKGLKMELTSLKNCIVKTNQRKAEYTALIEEEEQLRKLGISQ